MPASAETRVRTAGPADRAALVRVDAGISTDPGRAEQVRAAIDTGDLLVAERCGAVAGYARLSHDFLDHDFLALLVVAEDARRRRIGTALVRACIARCAGRTLFTSTNASNAPMRALLEREGFVLSGVLEHLDPGDPEHVYCRLADGPGGP